MTRSGFRLGAALSRGTRGLPPRTARVRMGKSARMASTSRARIGAAAGLWMASVIVASTDGLSGGVENLDHHVATLQPDTVGPHRQHRPQALWRARRNAEGRAVLGALDGQLVDVDLTVREMEILVAA